MSKTQERRPGEIANSAFATTVMAAFFPVFLKEYWVRDTNIVSDPFPAFIQAQRILEKMQL